jgi:Icc-related predicted phosphoesterase
MVITLISDTHTKHEEIRKDLPGGDLIIHAGDLMNSGYEPRDIAGFVNWYSSLLTMDYKHRVFIAGNHDRMFEDNPELTKELINAYSGGLIYLQDQTHVIDGVKIYGSPWQPAFYDWAFNLPRCGQDLMRVWNAIPNDTDILITHGPPFGHLDVTPSGNLNVGCELLRVRVDEIKPKIHVFGHVHSGYGYKFHEGTHFINAAVLNERYKYANKPLTVEWDPETNELEFI